MAIATRPKRSLIPVKHTGYHSTPSRVGITNGQTFKKGAPVIDSSGKLVESTSPVGVTNKTLGVAQHDASTETGDKDLLYVPATQDELYEGELKNSGAGTTHTLAQTDLYLVVAVSKDATFSTGRWFLDANAADTTTTTAVANGAMILGFVDAVGTTDARVVFKFTPAAVQTAAGIQY